MSSKRILQIKPFKSHSDVEDYRTHWKNLREAIIDIFEQKPTYNLSYEKLYRYSYSLVQAKKGDYLYDSVEKTFIEHLNSLYEVIKNQDNILISLVNQWNHHLIASQKIRDILMYMDNVYVGPNSSKRKTMRLSLELFRDLIIREPIRRCFLEAMLHEISRDRNGEVIDKHVLKSVCQMLLTLSMNYLDFYEREFEVPFLKVSREFYKNEAQKLLSMNNCVEYLKRVEIRLKEEQDRTETYLHKTTRPLILQVIKEELLIRNFETLIDMERTGEKACLLEDRYEDLKRQYVLFQLVPDGHKRMQSVLYDLIKSSGEEIIKSEEYRSKEKTYIKPCIELKDKYDAIVEKSFQNDLNFQNVVLSAFEYFFNLNDRSAEFLSLFIDEKLRKGTKDSSEEDLEDIFNKTMKLFRSLNSKDMFERYYKQHLAKRLLFNRCSSDDTERGMIFRLKEECGYQYTSKLEGMFTDMKTSAEAMIRFKDHLVVQDKILPFDFSVSILTTGYWPTSTNNSKCILPDSFKLCCSIYEQFYLKNHSGRVLNWLTHMGTVDSRATFNIGSKSVKRHDLNVSTTQMFILLLFNQKEEWKQDEIREQLKIDQLELEKYLIPLCHPRHQILLKTTQNNEKNYKYNNNFKHKLFRIKIASVSQKETEDERENTQKAVEEYRGTLIEAAIVRIMKSKKTLQHNVLVAEVIRQISNRFNPSPQTIKKRIELLIEREFLERSTEDRSVYNYLA